MQGGLIWQRPLTLRMASTGAMDERDVLNADIVAAKVSVRGDVG